MKSNKITVQHNQVSRKDKKEHTIAERQKYIKELILAYTNDVKNGAKNWLAEHIKAEPQRKSFFMDVFDRVAYAYNKTN